METLEKPERFEMGGVKLVSERRVESEIRRLQVFLTHDELYKMNVWKAMKINKFFNYS